MIRLAIAAQNAMLSAVGNLVDAARAAGTLSLYAGAMPGKPEDSIGEAKLLARMKFSRPGFGKPSAHSVTAVFETGEMALDNGRCAWARVEDGAGHAIIDVAVGDEESDAPMKINTVEIRKGGPVIIRSFTLEV